MQADSARVEEGRGIAWLPRALPRLDGRGGTAVRTMYWVFAAMTLVVVAGSIWFNGLDMFRNVPATMARGFRTFTAAGVPQIQDVWGADARRAGLRDGDHIEAIDGFRLPLGTTEFDIGERLQHAGNPVTLAIRHADGTRVMARLPRIPDALAAIDLSSGLPTWLYATITFLSTEAFPVSLLAASVILARRRGKDAEAMLFAFAFAMLCWEESVAFWLRSVIVLPDLVFETITNFAWIAAFAAIAGFPDGRFATRLAQLSASLGAAFVVGEILVTTVARIGHVHPSSALAQIFRLWFLVIAVAALWTVIVRYRRTPAGSERQQIKWAVMGFCISATVALVLLPLESVGTLDGLRGNGYAYVLQIVAKLLVFGALPLGLLVSLLRYRLYDVDAAISRSAAFALLTVSLLAIFAGSEKVIEILGERYFGESMGALAGGLGAAVAAVMIAPVHHRVTHWAEHHFRKGLLHLRHDLPLLVGDLRETASAESIADAVLKRVEHGVQARGAALIAGDAPIATRHVGEAKVAEWRHGWLPQHREGTLDCRRDDPLFPMRVPLAADGCGLVGWLLLGPRPDGSFYGKDEREALLEIADPIARALAIVRERDAREAALERRLSRLEAAAALRPNPATAS